jgi:trans-2,3-dihydro-3-hydroxyanthranilate isomerase
MENRKIKFFISDVFGIDKYTGNQLAVFPEAKDLSDIEMQQIAREINFSETTFITALNNQKREYSVRIFTPGNEVPFAGHPTLGTAHIIFQKFLKPADIKITLNVKAGKIPVKREGEIMWMQQIQPEFSQVIDKKIISKILNLRIDDINEKFPVQQVSTGLPFILIPLNSLDALKKAKINNILVRHLLKNSPVKEFMVFCTEGYSVTDKISTRVFVEEFGIPEDPATGSATGCLAAYLLKHNILDSNRIELSVAQGYEIGRPSRLFIKASLINDMYQINIGGLTNIIAEGYWH